MVLKLYRVDDSPPCIAVEMCLKYLKAQHESVNVKFEKKEHFSEEYLKKNPNGEVPCLEDNGFFLSESVAIMQYLADKYKKDETFYPSELEERAKVNHLLAFNLTTLYRGVIDYWVNTTFYAYPKLELNFKKMKHATKVFNSILGQYKGPYAAGTDKVTIADVSLLMTVICLDSIDFEMSEYPNVTKWYNHIKKNDVEIWDIAQMTLDSYRAFIKNPPEESVIPASHPIHPCKPSEYF